MLEDASLLATLDASHSRIGERYVVLGLLGAGGMGSVYRVRDAELDEVVALKMLRDVGGGAEALARFRAEVKLARRVTHRNVARTFDIGEHGEHRFLTMELVEGESLAARLAREGALDVTDALDVARQLAAGLAAAHAVGVVHRDVKLDNVVVEPGGRAVVTDFGIACAPGPGSGPASFAGTPATMAPEQVRGLPDIDARADVYALGAVLFELLTGAPAWTGPNPLAAAIARLEQPPPDPRARVPSLPSPLAELVVRMLATERASRPADGAAVLRALEALEVGGHAEERPLLREHALRASRLAPVPEQRLTLAVLPLRVDDTDAALGVELREDLVDRLARAGGLRVRPVSPQRVRALGGGDADPFELGRGLDVDVLVSGSLRRTAGGVRLGARALDVGEELVLWSDQLEGAAGEVFALNDQLACALGDAVATTVRSEGRRALSDPRALERYVAARSALRLAWSGTLPLAPVVAQFDEALALAPEDPLVLAGAAMARARARNFDVGGQASGPDAARAFAERARALAPDAAEPRLALATIAYAESDWPEAARQLRATLSRAPALAQAHLMLGTMQAEVGSVDEARARLSSALLLDAGLTQAHFDLARLDALEGRWDRVDALLLAPSEHGSGGAAASIAIAACRFNLWLGERRYPLPQQARTAELGLFLDPFDAALDGGPVSLDAVRETFARLRRGSRFRHAIAQLWIELAASVGWADEALEVLVDIAGDRLYDATWLARCPALAALRARAEFAGLCAQVEARCVPVREALIAPSP